MTPHKGKAGEYGGGYNTPDESWYSSYYAPDIIDVPAKHPWQNPSVLHQKYVLEELSTGRIAKEFLCSKNAIRNALIRANIPLRKRQTSERASNPHYGSRIIKGQRVEHLTERRVINTIVEMRDEGLSFQKIASFLSKVGMPTKKRGSRWHGEVVRQIYMRASNKYS